MFGPREGSWWVVSKSDPRWNKHGRGSGLVCTGGPDEAGDWIKECQAKFGEIPEDLEKGFMKD